MSILLLFGSTPASLLSLAAIPSAEAFGAFALVPGATPQSLSGLGSMEQFGAFTLVPTVTLNGQGVETGEAWGSLSLQPTVTLSPSGLTTGEAFGAAQLTPNSVPLTLAAIATGEQLGLFSLQTVVTIGFSGIPSAESFGSFFLTNSAQTLRLAGIASAERFGKFRSRLILSKRVTTFSNGQVLTSLATTPEALNMLLQQLTCQMLGLDPASDPLCYAKVRLDWPTGGQPGWGIQDDVCFLKTTEEDDPYNRIRDRRFAPNDAVSLLSTDSYTRVWRVSWSCYGPNSFDNARLIRSALATLDFPHDTLQQANLFVVTDFGATTRNPELFQGRWWERTDFSVKLYELVEETLTMPTIRSVEIILNADTGAERDITIAVT